MYTHLYIERERKGGDIERVKDTRAHGHAHTHTKYTHENVLLYF